jgi:SAM-dependent methyltransferase
MSAAAAEALPFDDDVFDAALAQLVAHFMADPIGGLREMRRVTKASGVVAACVRDHAGGHGPLGVFWEAPRVLDIDVDDESSRAGARRGHLAELLEAAGFRDVEDGAVSVEVEHRSSVPEAALRLLDRVKPSELTLPRSTVGSCCASRRSSDVATAVNYCWRSSISAVSLGITRASSFEMAEVELE